MKLAILRSMSALLAVGVSFLGTGAAGHASPLGTGSLPENPFGVMLGDTPSTPDGLVATATSMRARYVRLRIVMANWDGTCELCETYRDAGFEVAVTVRTDGGNETPSSPPADLAAYRATLEDILAFGPSLLVVENEPEEDTFWSGSTEQYGQVLAEACEVADSQGLPCTDGGMSYRTVRAMMFAHYLSQGRPDLGESFILRTSVSEQEYENIISDQNRDALLEKAAAGEALLDEINSAGSDLVNLHWFADDADALQEVVEYFHTRTGLPAISNEMKVRTDDEVADLTATMERVLTLDMPVAIFLSIDADPPGDTVDTRALHNPDGTLRPTGERFSKFIKERVDGDVSRAVEIAKQVTRTRRGTYVTISGRIVNDIECQAGQDVLLEGTIPRPNGQLRRFHQIAEGSTDAAGAYAFTFPLSRPAAFQVVAPAEGACGSATSPVVR